MAFQPNIFREYDIRGIADEEFDVAFAKNLGLAYASLVRTKRSEKKEWTVSVGRDCRKSGPKYQNALTEGLLEGGLNVMDIGLVSTPMLYYSTFKYDLDGGIMVSASHNPSEYNGFKISLGTSSLHGLDIQHLKKLVEEGAFSHDCNKGVLQEKNLLKEYLEELGSQFNLSKKLNVIVDAGNAVGAIAGPTLYKNMGCEVTELFCELDGDFPNHHPDPTVPKNLEKLIEKIKSGKYDVGLAFDGDADRIGAVDHEGNIIFGDQLMVLYSRSVLKNHPGATIISEVKSSQNLYNDIEKHGGNGIMFKTGHSLIKQKMKDTGAKLAGEMSGHMFFADRFYGFDDAIYAGARLIEILDQENKTIPELLSDLPKTVSTPEIRVDADDDKKFGIVDGLLKDFKENYSVNDIDGARIQFEKGWGLVRASNTQPALVLRFEAQDEDSLKEIRDLVESKVNQALQA